jgi:hypothetical protein
MVSDATYLSMILSDLPSPAEASSQPTKRAEGFAQAGNRFPSASSAGQAFWDHALAPGT